MKRFLGWTLLLILVLTFVRVMYLAGTRATSTSASAATTETPTATFHKIGDVVMVKHGPWVCAPSADALDEIVSWAVRKDTLEMLNVMRRTGSFLLSPDGWQVKILDSGWSLGARKIRVIGWPDLDDGQIHAYPEEQRIGRECWVQVEAVQ